MTLGEPDFNTPEHIKQAAIKSINENHSHYSPNAGIPRLRKAAAKYYDSKFNLNYKPQQVIVTIGATEGISTSLQTIINPGDYVLMPTPVFPIYGPISQINHGKYIPIDTSKDNFVLTPKKLKETLSANKDKNIKALILVYPSNPTGVTYSRELLKKLAKIIKKAGIWVLCDEVYAELTYNGKHSSLAEFLPKQVIMINGLSKSHAMTGWRIGYIMGPKELIDQAIKAHQYMVTSPTDNVQYAALEAMENGKSDSKVMLKQYIKRRNFLIKELQKAGFSMANPDGAFYLFAKIPEKFSSDSWKFVKDLAKNARVALIPGISFGPGGEGYVRLSYAASMDKLSKAVKRIQSYTKSK